MPVDFSFPKTGRFVLFLIITSLQFARSESNYALCNIPSFAFIPSLSTSRQHKWTLVVREYNQMIPYVKIFMGNIHWEGSFAHLPHIPGIARQQKWKLQFIIFP